MQEGIVATLKELIDLRSLVQKGHRSTHARAARLGQRETHLRGRGMDFAEVRNYQAGDEIRHMEWRSTARTGRPHIKLYQEERERPVVLMVDFNPSMYFGTRGAFKSVLAARLAALIAWLASTEGDRVGSFLFSGTHHLERAPKARHKGVLPLLSDLVHYTEQLHRVPHIAPCPLNHILLRLRRVLKPGSLLILISDFYSLNDASEPLLSRLKQHNDIVAYHIADTFEVNLPKSGIYPITDNEQTYRLNLSNKVARQKHKQQLDNRNTAIQYRLRRLQIPYHLITTETDWVAAAQQSFPRSFYG